MKTALIVMGIILAVLIIVFIVLSIVGKKLQAKQEASQEQMKEASQIASILVIGKKRMKLKEAGLPKMIVDNTPKYLRGSKIPVVKAKIGPRIMTLMCDEKIFRCPKCHQMIRVPKGRGKIAIRCPKCKFEFIRRS